MRFLLDLKATPLEGEDLQSRDSDYLYPEWKHLDDPPMSTSSIRCQDPWSPKALKSAKYGVSLSGKAFNDSLEFFEMIHDEYSAKETIRGNPKELSPLDLIG